MLFISNTKSYQAVKPWTLAKWLLETMDRAGIDTAIYKAHSVRSASALGMLRQGLSLQQILQRANWYPGSRAFSIFTIGPRSLWTCMCLDNMPWILDDVLHSTRCNNVNFALHEDE